MKQPALDLLSKLQGVSHALDQLEKMLHAMLQESLPASEVDAAQAADRAKVSSSLSLCLLIVCLRA